MNKLRVGPMLMVVGRWLKTSPESVVDQIVR